MNLSDFIAKIFPPKKPALPSIDINKEDIDQYKQAFSSRTGSIARYCRCGKVYYNADSPNYFDEGELEGYQQNENAHHVDYSPGGVYVLGIEYCNACDCWHRKAQQVVDFLREEQSHIAEFYRLERAALTEKAAATPIITP